MRCFIAIDLPEEVKVEIIKVQRQIPLDNLKLKFVEKENLHLTLKFLGELEDFRIQKIKEKLKEISFHSFKVKLANTGIFPSESFIRVIWIGVNPDEKVLQLQKEIDEKLLEIGFRKEKQFSAHVTIARVKFVEDKIALIKNMKAIKIKPIEFSINSFKLKKSILSKQGHIYGDVLEFKI